MLKPLLARYPAHLGVDAGGWAERLNPDRPALRSRFVLEGLQRLGLEFANVAARDLRLGPDSLQVLADSTQVQFVSANITIPGARWLRPYAVLSRQLAGRTVRIGITGVSSTGADFGTGWTDPAVQPQITDPIAAAAQMLQTLEGQTDLQVLLAYDPVPDLEKHLDVLGGYDLLVSGAGDLRESPAKGGLPVVLSPGTKCKFAGWATVRPNGALGFLYSDGDVVQLDTKIPDDPATAALVQRYKTRLGEPPAGAKAAAAAAGADSTPTH